MMLSTKAHSEDIYLNHPPLFHLAGMGQTLAVLAAGGTVIVVDTWNPTEILGLIESERVNFLYLVPPQLYRMITEHPEIKNYDVSTVKKLVTSAGGNSPAIVRSLYDTFPHLKLCLYGWGQTETASGTVNELTAAMVEEEPEKTQSVGREIYFTEIRLVDKDGAEVPVGEMGEAVVRTPSSFVGYLDRPELTGEILQDGWVHTGDIFEKDSEGFFYLRDRKKDMIKCGGENVFAQEVECRAVDPPFSRHVRDHRSAQHQVWGGDPGRRKNNRGEDGFGRRSYSILQGAPDELQKAPGRCVRGWFSLEFPGKDPEVQTT